MFYAPSCTYIDLVTSCRPELSFTPVMYFSVHNIPVYTLAIQILTSKKNDAKEVHYSMQWREESWLHFSVFNPRTFFQVNTSHNDYYYFKPCTTTPQHEWWPLGTLKQHSDSTTSHSVIVWAIIVNGMHEKHDICQLPTEEEETTHSSSVYIPILLHMILNSGHHHM